jgi:hypothetical protein
MGKFDNILKLADKFMLNAVMQTSGQLDPYKRLKDDLVQAKKDIETISFSINSLLNKLNSQFGGTSISLANITPVTGTMTPEEKKLYSPYWHLSGAVKLNFIPRTEQDKVERKKVFDLVKQEIERYLPTWQKMIERKIDISVY